MATPPIYNLSFHAEHGAISSIQRDFESNKFVKDRISALERGVTRLPLAENAEGVALRRLNNSLLYAAFRVELLSDNAFKDLLDSYQSVHNKVLACKVIGFSALAISGILICAGIVLPYVGCLIAAGLLGLLIIAGALAIAASGINSKKDRLSVAVKDQMYLRLIYDTAPKQHFRVDLTPIS